MGKQNNVYLRPTVVVSEGFRNLSVVLGNFRTVRVVKPASAMRLTSDQGGRQHVDNCHRPIRKNAPLFFPRFTIADAINRSEMNISLGLSLILAVVICRTVFQPHLYYLVKN